MASDCPGLSLYGVLCIENRTRITAVISFNTSKLFHFSPSFHLLESTRLEAPSPSLGYHHDRGYIHHPTVCSHVREGRPQNASR